MLISLFPQTHRDALFYFNGVALEDADFGASFALLFSSQQVQTLNDQFQNRDDVNVIRSNILNMLQENYSGKINCNYSRTICGCCNCCALNEIV